MQLPVLLLSPGRRWLGLLLLLLAALPALAQPSVTGFSPASGAAGSNVVITGSGFTGATSVRFGELSAKFTVNSGSQITAVVPRAASTQPINVTTSAGFGLTASAFAVTRGSGLTYALVSSNFAGVSAGSNAAPAVADIDGDNLLDLLVGRGDGTISRYEQTAVNGTSFSSLGLLSTGAATIDMGTQATVAIVDLEGNGRFNLVLGRGDGTVSEYEQTSVGAGTFALVQDNLSAISTTSNTVTSMTDLDGDGRLELLVGKGDGITSHSQQSFTNTDDLYRIDTNFNGLQLSGNAAPFCVDLDGNGRIDILMGVSTGGIYRYEQMSAGSFSVSQQSSSFNGISAGTNAKPCVTDIDGDGLLDLLVGRADGTISRYEQGAVANSAPTDISLSPASVAENQAVGTTVGTLSSTDPNAGNTFTYTFATGGADNGSFNILGSTLTTNASFNYEVRNSYSIKIRSTDQGSLFFEKTLTVTVSNVSETPGISGFTPTSGPAGTSVTINGSQFQNAGAVTVRFNGTVASGVSVSSNGQLTVPVPSGATSGTISVQNADGTGTSSTAFTVVQPAPNTTIVSGPPTIGNNSTVSFQFSSDQSPVEYATSGAPNATYSNNGATPNFGPIPDGSYTLSVAARNTSTNVSDPTPATYAFTIDTQAPTPTLGSPAAASTRTSPIPFTLTFPENVTGFALSDLTVTGGTAGSLSGSGASYSFSVTPTASGNPPATITVALAANRVLDAAGNNNVAATTISRSFDTQAPTLVISGPGGSTSTSPLSLTATFSEPVTGFALSDLTVTNGTASSLSGSGNAYTFSVTPSGAGIVTVSAATGAARDEATNNSAGSNNYSVTYAPPVTVTSITPTATPTNAGATTFTVTFSGSVTGVTTGSFTLTASGISGATIASVTGSGSSRTVTVNTGSGDGTLRLNLSSGAGIAPTVSNAPYTSGALLTVDRTAPVGTVGSGAASPTRTSPIPFNVTFSEAVTGFTLADLTVTNGTAGSLSVSGNVYSFSITPTANGPVTVQLEDNTVTDAAGNANAASNTLARTFDNQGPTPTLATTAGSATNTAPFAFTLTFSEPVTGLALTDLTVSGGTASGLTGSGASYTFSITPSGSGNLPSTITVSLSANRVTDVAGNNNVASNAISFTYDTQVPTVSISSTAPNPTNAAPIPVTVTFSEPVTGFSLADVTVGNGTAGSLSGSGTTYTFSVTPASNGPVSARVNAGAAQDEAGNPSTASAVLGRTFDNQGPTVTLSSPASSSGNVAAFTVTATFSQPVSFFTLSDLVVTGGTASNLVATGGTTYTFTLTASGTGNPASTVSVELPANRAIDVANNGNSASNTLTRTFDTVAPTVALSSTAPASSGTAAFTVAVLFAEPVTGFALTDLTVTNGTPSALTGSGASYSFTVTASGSGNPASTVSVTLPANRATDQAGNNNTASNTLTRSFDTQAPTATLSSTAANPTATSPIPVTVTFSESVTGFSLADVTVGNGAAGSLSGSGASYTFNVTPTGAGTVTVNLAAGAAQDAAGNLSTAATTLSRTYQPAAAITGVGPSPALSNDASITFAVTTTVPVTGWTTANFSLSPSGISGAGITGVTVSGNTATVTVNTGSGDGTLRLNVPNANGLTPTLSNVPYTGGAAIIDRSAPVVSGVSNGLEYNTNRTITFVDAHTPTATLNGAAFASGGVVSVEDSYTLVVTDGAGNVTTVEFVVDKTAPSTVITAGPGALTNDATPGFSFDSPDGGVLYATTGGPGLAYSNNGPNSVFGPLADGSYTLTVAAVDAAGNVDPTPVSYTFTVDTQAPNTSITAQPADPTTATMAHFEFAATEAGSTFEASLDGAPYAPVNPANTNYSGLTPGSHTLTVRATDPAGNEDASPASYSWTIVPPAPTLTALSPAAELPGQPVTLTGTNFTPGSTVSFGGVAASVTYNSPTSLTAVVPASATPGASAVLVTTATGANASAPAFEVLAVLAGPAACVATAPYLTTGDGQWHYLRLPTGEVVAALHDDNSQLGSVTADVTVTDPAQPVRQDGCGRAYLDRNFHLTATNPTFVGSSVQLRFYGLASELSRLTAADPAATPTALNATQYSGANEDCELGNNDFETGEFRVLAAPATVPGNGTAWFVSTLSVADHFSEFYLTGSSTPLPVELTSFTATAEGPAARLRWATASEKNSARFEVERSRDGREFARIGEEKAQGSKASRTAYTFLDEQLPAGTFYYRLRQVDQDGTASYSPVRAVTLGGQGSLTLYPNPARSAVAVAGLSAGAPVDVLDAMGRPVARATADAAGTARLTLPTGLAAGVYIVRSGARARRLTVE